MEGATGYVLADDVDHVKAPYPIAMFLPALDPTSMGWRNKDWYLGEYRSVLFDRNGNAGPSVWWAGRIVGGWAQLASGEVVFRLFEDNGVEASEAISARASQLTAWLGGIEVKPRFPTPLQKQLAAG